MNILSHTLKSVYLNGDLDKFKSQYNWDGTHKIWYLPIEFGQTIIKMSYSFAVAELGSEFFTPFCIPQIRSEDLNISYVFGQLGMNEHREGPGPVWTLDIRLQTHQKKVWVIVYYSLFHWAGTPVYEVVVGILNKAEQFELLNAALLDGRAIHADPSAQV